MSLAAYLSSHSSKFDFIKSYLSSNFIPSSQYSLSRGCKLCVLNQQFCLFLTLFPLLYLLFIIWCCFWATPSNKTISMITLTLAAALNRVLLEINAQIFLPQLFLNQRVNDSLLISASCITTIKLKMLSLLVCSFRAQCTVSDCLGSL